MLAILLAASLIPLVPGTPGVEEAEAAVGTTKYEDFFNPGGAPARVLSGNTFCVASTERVTDYRHASTGLNRSDGYFVSKAPVSLKHDWTLRFTGSVPNISVAGTSSVGANAGFNVGFVSDASASDLNVSRICVKKNFGTATSAQMVTVTHGMSNQQSEAEATTISWASQSANLTASFDSGSDTLTVTLRDGSSDTAKVIGTKSMPNASKSLGAVARNSAHLYFSGQIVWWNNPRTQLAPPSNNLRVTAAFASMELPHFDPVIKEVKLYRKDSGALIGPNDYVAPGTAVRIDAVIQNTNEDAGGEEFPLHLKVLGATHADYPTVGVSVSGDAAAAAGRAVALTGTAAKTVSLDATVTAAAGTGASVGLQLVDDSFGSTYENGALLLNERPLEPAPGTVDPDNPGSGAGTDWHYARFPQANPNGWNNSPVTVRFYPGDFDEMELVASGAGAAPSKTLAAGDPDWVQAADTAGAALSGQARNTSTGAVSTQKAGTVKVDTTAPRLAYRAVVGQLDIDDSATVTSGVWKLHRTDASGAVAAGARAAAFREFALADGNGAAKQAVANVPNGWYVAEDAAGNLSDPLKVSATEPPSVERPPGSVVDPDDPNPPTPVGPPVGPGDDVPAAAVTEDDEGLRHAVINEIISEMIDPAAPPFGGTLDAAKGAALMDYRYAASSPVGIASVSDELLDASGGPLAAFDTKVPGECLVRRVVTDAQGNTTTINLHYRLTRDSCPPVAPLEPVDPSDPTGPTEPGEPITPDGPVTTDPDGTQHTEVSCEATEAVTRGTMGAAGAEALLLRHFAVADVDGGAATVTVQSMADAAGNLLSAIDLSRTADYRITYLVSDGAGNTTTVKLTYHLISSQVPGVVKHPEPGDTADLLPGDDPLNPRPRPLDPVAPPQVAPDGTQHAVVEDVMRVPVQEGGALAPADARSLMQRRYTFTPEGGGSVTELALDLAEGGGAAVSSIDRSQPGAWRITYKVADASGNTVTVRLRYLVVADAPSVTPQPDPDGNDPGGSTPGGRDPLPPKQVDVDPDTGLSHAIIEDTVTVPTSDEPMTPAAMGDFLKARYAVKSALADGKLERGPARLYRDDDARNGFVLALAASQPLAATLAAAPGEEVAVIDRSVPGDWLAEQVLTDSAGDTTTIRLHYLVRESSADVSGGGNGQGGGSGNVSVSEAGALPPSGGDGAPRSWSSRIHELPQTGGIFGLCPLHVMFALLMLLASAYGLSRLRQIRAERRWNEDEPSPAC